MPISYLLALIHDGLHGPPAAQGLLLERGHRSPGLVHVGGGGRKAEHQASGGSRAGDGARIELPAPVHAQFQGGPGGGRAEARHRFLGAQLEAVGGGQGCCTSERMWMRMRMRMGVRMMRMLVEISVRIGSRGDVS